MEKLIKSRPKGIMIAKTVGLVVISSAAYWIFDSIAVAVSNKSDFLERFLAPEPTCLVMRLLAMLVIAASVVITQWKLIRCERGEKTLRESEKRFRSLFEQAAVGVAEIEMSTGHFFTVNKRLCEIVGRTEAELLATTFHAITHPSDLFLHEEKTQLMLAGKINRYSMEKRYLRKDGKIVWVNITVSPLWKPGENPGRNMIVAEDITKRKKYENEIQRLAYYDNLTGLPNRRLFFDRLNQNIIRAKREEGKMAVMMLDLDFLKGINDKWGHDAGDTLIKETGKRIAKALRAGDTVARLGGDEFTVIIAEIDERQDVEIIAKKIMERISRPLKINKDLTTSPSVGLGIAIFPEHGSDSDTLIKNADVAMYRSKHTGEYQFFKPSANI